MKIPPGRLPDPLPCPRRLGPSLPSVATIVTLGEFCYDFLMCLFSFLFVSSLKARVLFSYQTVNFMRRRTMAILVHPWIPDRQHGPGTQLTFKAVDLLLPPPSMALAQVTATLTPLRRGFLCHPTCSSPLPITLHLSITSSFLPLCSIRHYLSLSYLFTFSCLFSF